MSTAGSASEGTIDPAQHGAHGATGARTGSELPERTVPGKPNLERFYSFFHEGCRKDDRELPYRERVSFRMGDAIPSEELHTGRTGRRWWMASETP